MSEDNYQISGASKARQKALNNTARTPNYLLPTSFIFTIDRIPILSNFITTITFPSQEYASIDQPTRLIPVKRPGQQMNFGNLDISFMVDENMESYMELHSWFRTMKGIDSFDPVDNTMNNYSDATLTILNSAKRPIKTVRFKYLFPVTLGGWEFNTQSVSPEVITTSASFAFTSFEIEKI